MAYDINTQLDGITGALALDIDNRIYTSSPYLTLFKKSAWPDEIGTTFETLRNERASISGANTWRAVADATGSGDAPCSPPATDVTFNQSRKSVTLEMTAVNGPRMCVEDLRSKWKRAEQLELATASMGELIRDIWIDKMRDSYIANANKKIVLAPTLPETGEADGDTFDATNPSNSILTNEILDKLYMFLLREGGRMHATSMNGGQPIFTLICSAETSRSLMREDSAIREDFRQSSESDVFLKSLGHNHTYNGFLHMIDDLPRRFTHAGGAWTRITPWADDGVTGFPEQNPDYEAANHEDSVIFVNDVIECLVPGAISKVAKADFTPQNYIGDIQWLNYQTDDNPTGTIGRFYAQLGVAIRPYKTQFGVVIRHLRCGGGSDYTAVTCS